MSKAQYWQITHICTILDSNAEKWELELLDEKSDFKTLIKELGLKISPETGMFRDSTSGLVGYIFRKKEKNELYVVFDGTTSGKKLVD